MMSNGFSWVVGGGWLTAFAGMAAATSVLRAVVARHQARVTRDEVRNQTQRALLVSLLRRATAGSGATTEPLDAHLAAEPVSAAWDGRVDDRSLLSDPASACDGR